MGDCVAEFIHLYSKTQLNVIAIYLSRAGLASWVVKSFIDLENYMTSLERVNQLASVPQEGGASPSIEPPAAWPVSGHITFDNVVLRYRETLTPALRGLSFEVRYVAGS